MFTMNISKNDGSIIHTKSRSVDVLMYQVQATLMTPGVIGLTITNKAGEEVYRTGKIND